MSMIALVTDMVSLPIDYDMPLLLEACAASGLSAEVRAWEDTTVDWSRYDAAILRSPWNYVERLSDFLAWCERTAAVTQLLNPVSVARWALDKHYLADLAAYGVPIVPSRFVKPGENPLLAVREFFAMYPDTREIVVKPTIGAYSTGVKRYLRPLESEAAAHIAELCKTGCNAILQPYLDSIDRDGETDLIYFDGVYSHAICKSAMLMADGTVHVPTLDFRKARVADEDERSLASSALAVAGLHLGLDRPLLYGRVDLIRGDDGKPVVLEMELCEPSLSLPFSEGSAMRLVQALAKRLNPYERLEESGRQLRLSSSQG